MNARDTIRQRITRLWDTNAIVRLLILACADAVSLALIWVMIQLQRRFEIRELIAGSAVVAIIAAVSCTFAWLCTARLEDD